MVKFSVFTSKWQHFNLNYLLVKVTAFLTTLLAIVMLQ